MSDGHTDAKRLAQLMEDAKKLPPMTEVERQEQALNFTYGNLAASTRHKPQRAAFAKIAREEYGWSEATFAAWWKTITARRKT